MVESSLFLCKTTHPCYHVLDHAAQSPALNPLENIWCATEKALLGMSLPSNADNQFEKNQEVWDNYPIDELLKYINSCSDVQIHIDAVVKAMGYVSHKILIFYISWTDKRTISTHIWSHNSESQKKNL